MTSSRTSAGLVFFGEYEADLRSRELRSNGSRIRVADQAFQVLALLIERPGELVTREEIQRELWPSDTFVDFDHGLNNAVNRLREALGDSAATPRFIETLPKRGYRFIGKITVSKETGHSAAAAQKSKSDSWAETSIHLRSGSKLWAVIALAGVLVLLAVGIRLRRGYSTADPGHSAQKIQSLVVLPFQNLSGDPAEDYFADGLTDELIAEMAQIHSLRVISRTSAMHYKGTRQSLPEIARELNVDAVVEGSYSRSGDRVRITAQLVHAPTDRHLWAESYERTIANVFQLQSDLSQAIAHELAGRLTPAEQSRLALVHPVNTEAYEDYLRGRYFWNQRTEIGLRKSKEYFDRAIQKAPDYAPAYAGLADFYNLATFSEFGWLDPQFAGPKALDAAMKALKLDDTLAEAHAALGLTKLRYRADRTGAEQEFHRAIQLNPSYANTYIWYAFLLDSSGRHEQSCANSRAARKLDPLNPTYMRNVSGCLFSEGKHDEAIAEAKAAIELAPNREDLRYSLASFYEHEKRFPEAIEQYRELVHISNGGDCERSSLSYTLAIAGERKEAEKVLNDVRTHPAYPDFDYCLANAYVGLGRNDDAVHSLQEAFRKQGKGGLGLMTSEYRFAPLYADQRFQDLARRAGLSSGEAK